MKFYSSFFIVCICLPEIFAIHQDQSSTTLRYNCSANGYYADPQNCDIFYRCVRQPSGQFIAYKFSCSTGTVFSQHLIACTLPKESGRIECGFNRQPICYQNGFIGDTANCQIFYRCVATENGKYTRYKFICGPGTAWDQQIQSCNHIWAVSGCLEKVSPNIYTATKSPNSDTPYALPSTSSTTESITTTQLKSQTYSSKEDTKSSTESSVISTALPKAISQEEEEQFSTTSQSLYSDEKYYKNLDQDISQSIDQNRSVLKTYSEGAENDLESTVITNSMVTFTTALWKTKHDDAAKSTTETRAESTTFSQTSSTGQGYEISSNDNSLDTIRTVTTTDTSYPTTEILKPINHTHNAMEFDVINSEVTEAPVTETEVPLTEVTVTESKLTELSVSEVPLTEATVTESALAESTLTEPTLTESTGTELPKTEIPATESVITEASLTDSQARDLLLTQTETESLITERLVTEPTTTQFETISTELSSISSEQITYTIYLSTIQSTNINPTEKATFQHIKQNSIHNTTSLSIFSTKIIESIGTTAKPIVSSIKNHSKEDENPFENVPCLTPDKLHGTCLFVQECSVIYERHQRDILFKEDLDFLWHSQCGFFNRKIMVCCPKPPKNDSDHEKMPTLNNIASKISDNSNYETNLNLLPKPGVCGAGTIPRLIFGTRTSIFDYPWMALLEYAKPGGTTGFHCGGSLINNRHVLTASHCVVGMLVAEKNWTLISVRLGEWDINQHIDCDVDVCAPPAQDIVIQEKIPHKNYIPQLRSQYYDIALLRLVRKVEYSDWIRPLCLPIADNLHNLSFENEKLKAVGWGKTENYANSNVKLHVNVYGVNIEKCSAVYRTERIVVNSSQMCAIGNGADTCSGDSGGPLLAWGRDKLNPRRLYWYAAGITSFGTRECAKPGWPGIYTRVSFFVDWIVRKIRL